MHDNRLPGPRLAQEPPAPPDDDLVDVDDFDVDFDPADLTPQERADFGITMPKWDSTRHRRSKPILPLHPRNGAIEERGDAWEDPRDRMPPETTPEPNVPASRWPQPINITDLSEDTDAIDWLWSGCIARGHMTLMSALMKCGKSTLLGHLLRSLQTGATFLGRDTSETRTLVVSEESKAIWRMRRDNLGLDRHLETMCRPLVAKPSFGDWLEFIRHVRDSATRLECGLVVFDTIGSLAPWRSENDAAEVNATMTPLNLLTGAGFAVLLTTHIGKADGAEGRATRGSTALAGAVDVLLEMRRFKAEDQDDRRRVISGFGRFENVPQEVVIELAYDGSGYSVGGNRKDTAARDLSQALLDVLPSKPGLKADEVHSALPESGRPRRGDVMEALKRGAAAGRWMTRGEGRKGDPCLFWRAD